jgi:hypothetical protein
VTDRTSQSTATNSPRSPLPPDPVQYDAERNVHARKRGLPQAYIAGGNDPQLGETLRRERRYLRILLLMAIGIVAMGFVLGVLGALVGAPVT